MKRFRHIFYAFLILFALLGVCLSSIAFFQALLSKVGVSLGVRALSFVLIKIGFSGGILLAIRFAVRFSGDKDLIHWMDAGDGDNESPNQIKRKLKNFFLSCFHPKTTEDTLPEPQQAIDNWVEAVDFPQAHPNDSINP